MSKEFNPGNLKITKNENIYDGPHSEIDSVTLSSGEHSLNLLRKKVNGYPIEFMQGPEWHTALKEKGYPVFPTYRYDSEKKVEYITDLRRGSTHQVIDFCNSHDNLEKIHISNMEELEAEVKKLIDKSANDGLIINEPNIFFDVEISTGIAKVLLGDLREIGYETHYDGPRASREEIFNHNQMILKGHMDRLKAIMIEQKPTIESKIETIKATNGEVSYSPERGGIITSIKIDNKEVLYMDEDTFKNREGNVKGGIPILFPNAGPIPDEIKTEELAYLKQHGFARESNKWISQKTEDGFTEILKSDEETKKVFPYDFELSVNGKFEKDGSFSITQSVKNLETDKELPLSSGFHPYFKVSSEAKKDIEFNFKGGEFVKRNTEIWANGKAISIENPGVPIEIDIPNLGTLTFNIDKKYKRIWVWSQTGKDFICIEPVMRDKGGLVNDPEKIRPKETFSITFNLNLK